MMNDGPLNFQMLTPERWRWVMDIGESTEAEWRTKKKIDHFKEGRIIRYTPEAAIAFIQARTRKARGIGAGEAVMLSMVAGEDWRRIERLISDQVRAQLQLQTTMAA